MRPPTRSTRNCINLALCKDFSAISSKAILLRAFSSSRPLAIIQDTVPKALHVLERDLAAMKARVNRILQNTSVPSEESTLSELQNCEACAKSIKKVTGSQGIHEMSPASTLLSLDEQSRKSAPLSPAESYLAPSTKWKIARQVSELAYNILADPRVFITPKLLVTYVRTQSLLGLPETIPQVFVLYASKPIPIPSVSPIQFKASNPNKTSSAIPLSVATMALNAAIKAKDMPLCFDIINTSVCATAFRRSKLLRRALLPMSGVTLAPVATYSLASQLSKYQDTMDPLVATNLAFVGILAYVGFTATIGFIVITTRNDQMNRVTWASGTPLRERWLREDERALVDKVAVAWGFQEISRRGEEEGREWESLREWAGLRGLMLDRVELMEGME